jgi:hypothetical protein
MLRQGILRHTEAPAPRIEGHRCRIEAPSPFLPRLRAVELVRLRIVEEGGAIASAGAVVVEPRRRRQAGRGADAVREPHPASLAGYCAAAQPRPCSARTRLRRSEEREDSAGSWDEGMSEVLGVECSEAGKGIMRMRG